jgi:PTS system ascorbate-specific IIA component
MDEKLFAACQYTAHSLDWRGAIKLACRPLAQQGKISAGYADAIISATEKNGPWYILTRNLPSRTPARMKGF